jgi:hypothetical protein
VRVTHSTEPKESNRKAMSEGWLWTIDSSVTHNRDMTAICALRPSIELPPAQARLNFDSRARIGRSKPHDIVLRKSEVYAINFPIALGPIARLVA